MPSPLSSGGSNNLLFEDSPTQDRKQGLQSLLANKVRASLGSHLSEDQGLETRLNSDYTSSRSPVTSLLHIHPPQVPFSLLLLLLFNWLMDLFCCCYLLVYVCFWFFVHLRNISLYPMSETRQGYRLLLHDLTYYHTLVYTSSINFWESFIPSLEHPHSTASFISYKILLPEFVHVL